MLKTANLIFSEGGLGRAINDATLSNLEKLYSLFLVSYK